MLTICISFWISKVKLWKWYKEYIKCVCIYNVLFFCKWLWSLGYLSMCYVSPGWPWVIGTPISFWNAWVSHRAAQIKEKNHFLKLNQRLKVLLPENLSLSIPFFCVYTCVYLFVVYIHTHVCRSTCAVGKCTCIDEYVKGWGWYCSHPHDSWTLVIVAVSQSNPLHALPWTSLIRQLALGLLCLCLPYR